MGRWLPLAHFWDLENLRPLWNHTSSLKSNEWFAAQGVGGLETCHGERWQQYSSTRRYSTSPPHQSPSVPASPQGEAYAIRLCWGNCCGSFLHKPCRLCQSPSPGGPTVRGTVGDQINSTLALKVGRPEAGSDEGERRGFHSIGNRRTYPLPKGTHPRPRAPSRWARLGRPTNERATGHVIRTEPPTQRFSVNQRLGFQGSNCPGDSSVKSNAKLLKP